MINIDNIEKLKKINELAHELKKHNIASSADEAVEQARRMIEKGEKGIAELDSAKLELKPESYDYEFRKMKQQVTSMVAESKSELVVQINELRTKLNLLSREVSQLKTAGVQQVQRQEPNQTTIKAEQKASNEVKPHPKIGNYRPEEVAVDKIFYCGPK